MKDSLPLSLVVVIVVVIQSCERFSFLVVGGGDSCGDPEL